LGSGNGNNNNNNNNSNSHCACCASGHTSPPPPPSSSSTSSHSHGYDDDDDNSEQGKKRDRERLGAVPVNGAGASSKSRGFSSPSPALTREPIQGTLGPGMHPYPDQLAQYRDRRPSQQQQQPPYITGRYAAGPLNTRTRDAYDGRRHHSLDEYDSPEMGMDMDMELDMDMDVDVDVDVDGNGAGGQGSGKKHVCPTCFKRFNRPSSLRIHVNTHTGATREWTFPSLSSLLRMSYSYFLSSYKLAFRCPWPNCGREFNVNSNMRRHYRNHVGPQGAGAAGNAAPSWRAVAAAAPKLPPAPHHVPPPGIPPPEMMAPQKRRRVGVVNGSARTATMQIHDARLSYAQQQMEQMQIHHHHHHHHQQRYYDQHQRFRLGGHTREGYSPVAAASSSYPPPPPPLPANSYDARHGYPHAPGPRHVEEDRYRYERERKDRYHTSPTYPQNSNSNSYPPPQYQDESMYHYPQRGVRSSPSSMMPSPCITNLSVSGDEDENDDEHVDDGGMYQRQRRQEYRSYNESERQHSKRPYEHSYPTPVSAGNSGRGGLIKQELSEEDNNAIRATDGDEQDDNEEEEEVDQLASSSSSSEEEDRDDDGEYRASSSYRLRSRTQNQSAKNNNNNNTYLTVPDANANASGKTRKLPERSARRAHPYANNARSPSASPSLSPATPLSSSSTSSSPVHPRSPAPTTNALVHANAKPKYTPSIHHYDSKVMSHVSTTLRPAQGFGSR